MTAAIALTLVAGAAYAERGDDQGSGQHHEHSQGSGEQGGRLVG